MTIHRWRNNLDDIGEVREGEFVPTRLDPSGVLAAAACMLAALALLEGWHLVMVAALGVALLCLAASPSTSEWRRPE
jgi:hypothetical protein